MADVVIIEPAPDSPLTRKTFRKPWRLQRPQIQDRIILRLLKRHRGIHSIPQMARIMHEHGGLCFIDFAASAPYVDINMHPADSIEKLMPYSSRLTSSSEAPAHPEVMLFDKSLYKSSVPDQPGGGTGDWTNPWGEYKYVDNMSRGRMAAHRIPADDQGCTGDRNQRPHGD